MLKVDTDGSVITAEVAGATVDDALSTVSTNPVQNKVITEELLATEDKVNALEDQLYDEISHIEEHIYYDKPVNKPYASSSFAGWYGSVGRPAHIGYVDIPFKTRVDYPVTSINLKIYKLTRDITIDDFDYDEENDTYTGPFVSDFLVKVYEDNKTFETPLPEDTNQVIHFDLSEQIDNPENLQYIVGYECNNPITGGVNTNTTNKPWGGESYGPWIQYCTWNSSTGANSTTIDISVLNQEHKKFNLVGNSYNTETGGTYYSFAGKIGWLETVVERYISSEPDGKVGTIVQGVLDEMEITERLDAATAAAQLVEEAELPIFQGNSPIDLTDPEAVYSTFNPQSTFNGETQPIGKIPANVKIGGFRIPLQIRENIADPTLYRKANKAIIRLFAADSYSETGGDVGVIEWPDLNPVMVREKVIDIDLDLDDPNKISGIYNFFFDEPFYNTENKVLYLFVAINGRYMRTRVNGSANVLHTYINTHDGTEYAAQGQGVTLFSFYCAVSDCDVLSATSYSALHHRMWTDPQVFAYSIVDKLETYVASDMFNEWVDERTEDTIAQDIDEYMSTYVPPLVPDCEVRLPKKIYAVKGDKLQLFYDGMIKGFNPSYTHDITVRCSKGSNYTRYWEYTPTAADVGHSYSFQLIVRNFQGQYISSGTTTIEVLDVPDYSVAPTYNMLCFGDSLTGAGKWCSEGMRRLVGTDLTATGPKPMPALYGIDIVLNETPSWISSSDIGTTWKDNNNKNWLLESYKNNGLNIRFGRGSGNTDLMENITLPTSLTRTSPARTIAAGDIASVNWETVGLSLSSYGRKHNTNNTYTVYHEGYGGWTWGSFLDDGRTSTELGIFVTVDHTVTWDLDTVQHSEWIDNLNRNWKLEDIQDNVIKFDRGSGNTESSATAPLPTSLTCASLSLSIAQSEITSSVWEAGNPFWNELTQQVDFLTHAAELDHAPADIVSILLTWNGGSPSDTHFDYQSKIQTHVENATTLIRDIHRDLPNAKVICMGIQRSSVTGGAGGSYGADGSYADCWGTVYYSFDYNQALENLVTNEEFGQYCYYGDTKSQFDTEYLMPYNNVAVNTRSDITERRGSNGVHPSDAGYYAIGDAYFRTLVKVLNDIHNN